MEIKYYTVNDFAEIESRYINTKRNSKFDTLEYISHDKDFVVISITDYDSYKRIKNIEYNKYYLNLNKFKKALIAKIKGVKIELDKQIDKIREYKDPTTKHETI